MRIKVKFNLGLIVILVALGIALNILIRQILITNMENSINNSLKEVMNSSREYIKYRLVVNNSSLDSNGLKNEANFIIKYISLNYQCDSQINDMDGNLVQNEGNEGFEEIILKGKETAKDGKAVVDLKYNGKGVNGILSYPLYMDNNYLGIVTINKEFNKLYSSYNNTVYLISIIEFGVFLGIFILAYLMMSKITKPIIFLTNVVKEVADGHYDVSINVKDNDEVGILFNEFINMKDKIKEQIRTINLEKDKVERLEKGRQKFFNNVTHELKTPLTAISGYAEILLEGIVEDEEFRKRAIERIYSESERLHKLVLELIDVSKGVSYIEEEKTEVDMYKLLNQVCDDMTIKANKYFLEIDRDIAEGNIFAQANRIKEVIINVIDNAIKYTTDREKITVKAYKDEDFYNIEVVNKAEPIKQEILDYIFEPFIKSDNSKEEDSRGLGLYICREIVKGHDGEITIENGNEITTKVRLPLMYAE